MIDDDIHTYRVIHGKLPRGLRINLTSGIIAGKPRTAISKPRIITVAGDRQDGSLAIANPMSISIRRHGWRA